MWNEIPVVWMGQSKKDLLSMPDHVQDAFGYALGEAQNGRSDDGAVSMKGFLRGVTEIRVNHQGDTYRLMFTTELPHGIYALHAFKKKSKRRSQTPREDLARIAERFKGARALSQLGGSSREKVQL